MEISIKEHGGSFPKKLETQICLNLLEETLPNQKNYETVKA